MSNGKSVIVSAVIALAVALGVSFFVGRRPVPPEGLGATPGTAISGNSLSVGGVADIRASMPMMNGTSTLCAFAGPPSATSTLTEIVVEFTTASSTVGSLTLYKGSAGNATSGGVLLDVFPLDAEIGIVRWEASTTEIGASSFPSYVDLTFGPTSTPVVVQVEGLALSHGRFTGTGRCGVVWKSISPIYAP